MRRYSPARARIDTGLVRRFPAYGTISDPRLVRKVRGLRLPNDLESWCGTRLLTNQKRH